MSTVDNYGSLKLTRLAFVLGDDGELLKGTRLDMDKKARVWNCIHESAPQLISFADAAKHLPKPETVEVMSNCDAKFKNLKIKTIDPLKEATETLKNAKKYNALNKAGAFALQVLKYAFVSSVVLALIFPPAAAVLLAAWTGLAITAYTVTVVAGVILAAVGLDAIRSAYNDKCFAHSFVDWIASPIAIKMWKKADASKAKLDRTVAQTKTAIAFYSSAVEMTRVLTEVRRLKDIFAEGKATSSIEKTKVLTAAEKDLVQVIDYFKSNRIGIVAEGEVGLKDAEPELEVNENEEEVELDDEVLSADQFSAIQLAEMEEWIAAGSQDDGVEVAAPPKAKRGQKGKVAFRSPIASFKSPQTSFVSSANGKGVVIDRKKLKKKKAGSS